MGSPRTLSTSSRPLTQLLDLVRPLLAGQGDVLHLAAALPVAQEEAPRSAWALGSGQAWRLPRNGQPVV